MDNLDLLALREQLQAIRRGLPDSFRLAVTLEDDQLKIIVNRNGQAFGMQFQDDEDYENPRELLANFVVKANEYFDSVQ